jgi:hypothetical protein
MHTLRRIVSRGIVLTLCAAAAIVCGFAADAKGGGPYTAAAECARCHAQIHRAWEQSAHARSATSASFKSVRDATLKQAAEKRDSLEGWCAGCHAPTTLVTGDRKLQDPISREGITCDFCHTVASVDLARTGQPFSLAPGNVKRGPIAYTGPVKGHGTDYSFLHRGSPLLCAACHDLKGQGGAQILTTYDDWVAGPYPARGVSCQDCHMALIPGDAAKPEMMASQGPRVINLHKLVGGSSISQLNRGLDLKIEAFSTSRASAEIRVAVTNAAAGHRIPGGLPTKSLALVVGIETDNGAFQAMEETEFRRELRDSQGITLKSLADMLVRAAAAGEDSRLRPGETRRQWFRITLPDRARAVVTRLEYRDATDPEAPPKATVITQERREVPAR